MAKGAFVVWAGLLLLAGLLAVTAMDRRHHGLRQRLGHRSGAVVVAAGATDSNTDTEAEAAVHITTAHTAVEAVQLEVSRQALSQIKPFWGRAPECCLDRPGYDHVTADLYHGCTVYTIWQCFPIGNICEEAKPKEEPKPITYRVGVARADESLGPLVCNAGCPKCEKPRKNDISSRILGSLTEE